ncbi:MAG TPA: hypothetical protein VM925_04890 [Labilithrix sp.]|jgi:hypothetical protein|nr:hypothetical protein [Labilithrix sp.]
MSAPYDDDEALWTAFATATLPESAWTHHAHLRVGWMFTKTHPLDEAHVLMRVGIIRLNAFHQLVETPSRGYHETMTRVWLLLIRGLVSEIDAATSSEFVDACGLRLSKDAVLRHYSRERITSVRARAIFVDPDLEPFPPA